MILRTYRPTIVMNGSEREINRQIIETIRAGRHSRLLAICYRRQSPWDLYEGLPAVIAQDPDRFWSTIEAAGLIGKTLVIKGQS